MTADQQAAEAFDREWQHAVSAGLPPRPCLSDHGAVLKHHRCEHQLHETLQYYSRKLPAYLYAPRLLTAGAQLQDRADYRLAAELCFQRLVDLNLPAAPDSSGKLDAAGRLGLHVQALYGLHACHAAEALLHDMHLQHQHTISTALAALAGLQAACEMVMPAQPTLVLAGTEHIHKLAARLLKACGSHSQVLPHLLFAARAMESHISLSAIQHLPWRVQLYAAVAECHYVQLTCSQAAAGAGASHQQQQQESLTSSVHDSSGLPPAGESAADAAREVLAAGLAHLASIARAQSLDAVPAPDVTAAIHAAQAHLTLLQILFPQDTAGAGAAQPAMTAQQLLASLKAIGSSQEQLSALLRLLQSGLAQHASPLQRVQLPAHLQVAMEAAAELAASVLCLETPAGGQAAPAITAAGVADLHRGMLGMALQYQQDQLLQRLLSAVLGSAAEEAALAETGAASALCPCLSAAAAVLDGVMKVQEAPGDATMQQLAAVLVTHSAALGSCTPKLLSAAALELHAAAGPLLEGCFSHSDGNAEVVQAVLEGLHAALEAGADSVATDGVLQGSIALRLAALLEQQQQLDRALEVVCQGLAAVTAARCDALTHLQGQADEHVRWITGARAQPDNTTAAFLEGMSDVEQVLACLHADGLMLRSRLQLKIGMREAAAKTTAHQQRLQATLQKRDQQADIFGARTRKERRLDAAAVENAGHPPATAPDVEQRLLLECGHCPYQRALVLASVALVQPDADRQTALLEEACDVLHSAHKGEAKVFASQQPSPEALRRLSAHHIRPANPKVLCRTLNSISLTAFPIKVSREARRPAAFAAYCKPCAAGVSITVNKTAMEYPGSGVRVPIGGRVTIEGLQSNEAYSFAVAVYDDQGTLLGELGSSSPPIVMSLPLPVYYCYAQVLLAAAQLGLWTVAKRAAAVLFPRFITVTPARPLWEAHPADRYSIQAQQISAQVAPFLRLLVQAMYAYAGHQAAKHVEALSQPGSSDSSAEGSQEAIGGSSGLGVTAASTALLLGLSESRLPQQVALLEAAQRHLLAMQVAAQAGDEMLVEEGALRTFNLLTPLLQQQDISPTLFQPLSELHSCLAAVKDTTPGSISGHKKQRQQAAQALAAAGVWTMRILQPVGPVLACGSAAVAAHSVMGLQLKPSAALAALDGALLRVLAGSSHLSAGLAAAATAAQGGSSPAKAGKAGGKKHQAGHKGGGQKAAAAAGRPTTPGLSAGPAGAATGADQAKELAALQELLLWHPHGAAWAADLHATRCEDPLDLVAQVLPKLEQPHALITCWPLLSAPAAQSHPKWLPLCVLLMQAAARQHGAALWLSLPPAEKGCPGAGVLVGVSADALPDSAQVGASPQLVAAAGAAAELLQAVKQVVRLAARRLQFLAWPSSPRWTVEAGAAALEAEGFVLGDQGTAAAAPQPELPAGASAAAKTAATAAWQQQNAELIVQERRRLAAVQLLQQHLPVLLGRRVAILAARQQLAAWAPWLAQLHTIVGGLAAEAAAQLLAHSAGHGTSKPPAEGMTATQVAASTPAGPTDGAATARSSTENADGDPAAAAAGGESAAVGGAADAAAAPAPAPPQPPSVAGSKLASPRKSSTDSARPQTAAQPAGEASPAAAASARVNPVAELAQVLAVQAHQQFAQAATLAARSSHHQQLFSTAKQLQGVSSYLLNRLPALLTPAPAVTWTVQPLPDPQVPPLAAAALERAPADPTAGAAAGKGVGADKKAAASMAGSKAAGAGDKKPANGAGRPGKAGQPRADAKHTLLPGSQRPHVGTALRSVAAALLAALQQLRAQSINPGRPIGSAGTVAQAEAPLTGPEATAGPAAAEGGSVTARSFKSSASGFSFGSDAVVECWHAGSGVDVAGLTQLLAVVLRVLRNMERRKCMLELGSAWLELCQGSADAVLVPLLLPAALKGGSAADVAALQEAHKALAADRNSALDDLAKARLHATERLQGLTPLDNATSTGSGANQLSCQVADTRADFALVPAEYERVVAQLKKRGEKGHMILALNELGDVHAHLGNWSKASEAWSSAVDALLGVYHVVDVWRTKLELGSGEQQLKHYGVHGLLLAITILGKLARYTSSGNLGSRLSCALLAAELLPAVFCTDIIHPQRRLDFAAYVPLEIWPGVDVFEDPYRCNAAQLASSLECLCGILQEQQLHLLSLPLLSLWEHTSLFVTHDRPSTVLARITRTKALAALGLMPQAAAVLQGLMHGSNLPGLVLGPPQPVLGANGLAVDLQGAAADVGGKGAAKASIHAAAAGEGKEGRDGKELAGGEGGSHADSRPVLYHADKWPSDPANAGFLHYVAEATLDPAVVATYGPWLCGHTTLARCAFLAAAGSAVDCWCGSNKPAALAAALKAGPPPVLPLAELAAPSSEAVGVTGGVAAGGKGGAKAAPGAGAGGKAADGKTAAAATPSAPPPAARTPAEHKLLAAAARLLQGVVATSCPASGMSAAALGLPWADDGSAAEPGKAHVGKAATEAAPGGKDKTGSHASTAKASHGAGKAGKGGAKGKAGAHKGPVGHQQQSEQQAGADTAAAERRAAAAAELAAAQHQQLLVAALLQLAAVQVDSWLPLQALPVCLAACEAVKHTAGSSTGVSFAWTADSVLDSCQAESKASLQPSSSTWLAARTQLAKVLLQLHHHGSCVSVCLKALTDAARAGNAAWSAQLLGLQAAALVAQEEYLPALNCYRAALARLEEHKLPASLSLPLQLDFAALCDEVGACGDFDRLACASLGVSATEMQEMGLSEMVEHPQLTNIYLPAAATHLSALLAAASAATRRRQLATAERHLRSAAHMLSCCRCLPVHGAEVLTRLARVLRLQAALKLLGTALLVQAAPAAAQHQQAATSVAGVAGAAAAGSASSRSGSGAAAAQLQESRLHEAAHLLGSALHVLIADAGSNPVFVRSALLELAAVLLQAAEQQAYSGSSTDSRPAGSSADPAVAARVAAVLRAAHVTAGQVCKLLLESHSLQPVLSPCTCMPDWLLELLKGHEQLQQSLQQEAATAAAAAAAGAGSKATAAASSGASGTTTASVGTGKQAADGAAAGGGAGVTSAVTDDALGRLAVCFFVQQLAAMAFSAAGLPQQQRAAEQALLVQPVLRAACAKFAAGCCWPDVPPEVAAVLHNTPVPALPAGCVMAQWYRQDGCWQVPSSWSCHGALPSSAGPLTADALDGLPKQQPCISCLYVLVLPAGCGIGMQPTAAATAAAGGSAATAAVGGSGAAGGVQPQLMEVAGGTVASSPAGPVVLQGELVVGLARAKRVQLQVKSMRSRLESPGKPTDLFAQPAPSTAELAAVKHTLECLLSAVPEDSMPPPPADLPPPLVPPQQQQATPATAAVTAAAGAKPAAGAAAAAGKPPVAAKSSATGGTAGAAAAAGGKAAIPAAAGAAGALTGAAAAAGGLGGAEGAAAELDWRHVETWAKVEMLLDLEGGLQVTDAAVAVWLGRVLHGSLGTGALPQPS